MFLVTVLHRPWTDGTGQTRQDFLGGREEATEKDDSKKLQYRHLQQSPLLGRHTAEWEAGAETPEPPATS